MPHIKLDATASTNDYLKDLLKAGKIENFTVVSAENQTAGRGQMGAIWKVESGKNLTFSVFVSDVAHVDYLFGLNVAVAVSIVETLQKNAISDLSIKWPNDIMSGRKKIGGILIESIFRTDGSIWSVIGIGINVNQTDFENLPQASSLMMQSGREFNREELLESLVADLESKISELRNTKEQLWNDYHKLLFCAQKPAVYETPDGIRFNAIITEVLQNGKLKLELEEGTFREFGIKEIKMLF
ncbi:biotin--[acetyl-CoA-carboxylase] ligase [Flavobacterium silvaticum]|uniref:Biotin--[acetyl-CoA-carboxylase] ligase n=1 Tax=Flavobacterium silvaticum TaxID=1852020 RepID=A0A972FY57_9FLAO|nr:biotin--[acetyl-CoA-carboxylase] ligase [Flavobacterium silvaticum]NMH26991.1 biotin--[acetyl-CoA-carboxylase] ligase [Flavobacterium silvaticum]